MGETRVVGERGQVTIPKWMREQEGIDSGDEVEIVEEGGRIVIEKQYSEEELAAAYRESAERDREIAEEWKHVNADIEEQLPDWE
ncbi:MAG: AbrB/MazE/SpoVT family DNA-binding domain-containing protein [Candidatus Nanohaloarchaea archaeon]|nr:AbrB/MazE/SpoVT family DNA-binding domain-containing protein [Candidatus Nanohaloarchaea archaeon]